MTFFSKVARRRCNQCREPLPLHAFTDSNSDKCRECTNKQAELDFQKELATETTKKQRYLKAVQTANNKGVDNMESKKPRLRKPYKKLPQSGVIRLIQYFEQNKERLPNLTASDIANELKDEIPILTDSMVRNRAIEGGYNIKMNRHPTGSERNTIQQKERTLAKAVLAVVDELGIDLNDRLYTNLLIIARRQKGALNDNEDN